MGDTLDPFATPDPFGPVPGSDAYAPPPYGAPPYAAAPTYDGVPMTPPAPGALPAAPAGAQPPFGFPTPQGALPPGAYPAMYLGFMSAPWRRTWGVTMGRWGIGVGIAAFVGGALAAVAGASVATGEDAAIVALTMMFGLGIYMATMPWWIDHLVARWRRLAVWGLHLGVALPWTALCALVLYAAGQDPEPGDVPVPAWWWSPLTLAVVMPLALLLADLVKGSYRPRD